jgi:hypothetical protein
MLNLLLLRASTVESIRQLVRSLFLATNMTLANIYTLIHDKICYWIS